MSFFCPVPTQCQITAWNNSWIVKTSKFAVKFRVSGYAERRRPSNCLKCAEPAEKNKSWNQWHRFLAPTIGWCDSWNINRSINVVFSVVLPLSCPSRENCYSIVRILSGIAALHSERYTSHLQQSHPLKCLVSSLLSHWNCQFNERHLMSQNLHIHQRISYGMGNCPATSSGFRRRT